MNKIVCSILLMVGILMISIALVLENSETIGLGNVSINEFDINNMAAATNEITKGHKEMPSYEFKKVEMEVLPSSIERIEVFEGMTIEELSAKLDKSLKGEIAGKGSVIATNCLSMGVDPYVATAIILHETGCNAKCSKLVKQCNNVGGQKGYPRCGNTSFRAFDSLDAGIIGMISNLSRNYYGMGLDTVEKIAPKYCEGNTWAGKINNYIKVIRAR